MMISVTVWSFDDGKAYEGVFFALSHENAIRQATTYFSEKLNIDKELIIPTYTKEVAVYER